MKAPAAIRFRLIATGLAVIGLGAYGVLWFRDNGAAVETDNAYIRSEITPVAPKVTGYVTEVAIGDDQLVRAADILFRIDDADYRARVLQAEGVVAERHAALANADERIRLQETAVRQARATIQATEADAQRTRLDWERASQLLQMGSGSRQKFDTASADRTRLRAQSDRDQANLAAAQQTISVLLTERDQKAAQFDSGRSGAGPGPHRPGEHGGEGAGLRRGRPTPSARRPVCEAGRPIAGPGAGGRIVGGRQLQGNPAQPDADRPARGGGGGQPGRPASAGQGRQYGAGQRRGIQPAATRQRHRQFHQDRPAHPGEDRVRERPGPIQAAPRHVCGGQRGPGFRRHGAVQPHCRRRQGGRP